MSRGIFLNMVIVAMILLLSSFNAFANGRRVGIRATDVAVNAVIEDRTGQKHEWRNVHVLVGDVPGREIEYRYGDSEGTFVLSTVSKISMVSNLKNDNDYVTAEITKNDGTRGQIDLRVKKSGFELMLTGKGLFGAEKILLLKCKHIEFQVPASTAEERSGDGPPPPPLLQPRD